MCKNIFIKPAKSTEGPLEGDFKDSITRKRWLGGREGESSAYSSVVVHYSSGYIMWCSLAKFEIDSAYRVPTAVIG